MATAWGSLGLCLTGVDTSFTSIALTRQPLRVSLWVQSVGCKVRPLPHSRGFRQATWHLPTALWGGQIALPYGQRRAEDRIVAQAKGRKGFGAQPVKKYKRGDRAPPAEENKDPVTRAKEIVEQRQNQAPGISTSDDGNLVSSVPRQEEASFEQKLAMVRRSAEEQRSKQTVSSVAAIDYDAPPQQSSPDAEQKPWTDSPLVKAGLVASVLAFGIVLLAGDYVGGGDSSSKRSASDEMSLSEEERSNFQARIVEFEAVLKQSPQDADALEGAAVSYAELGDFNKAADYLRLLVKVRPEDGEALRLLAEVNSAMGKYGDSASAYRRSIKISKSESLPLLRGLTDVLITDGKPGEAVGELLAARGRLQAASATSEPAGTQSADAPSALAVDPVQVELLLGKAYAAWGKTGDAAAVYDALIAADPEDFRGYLAKGVLFKEQGRTGEAERMFVQARYWAPAKGKALVDRLSGRE